MGAGVIFGFALGVIVFSTGDLRSAARRKLDAESLVRRHLMSSRSNLELAKALRDPFVLSVLHHGELRIPSSERRRTAIVKNA